MKKIHTKFFITLALTGILFGSISTARAQQVRTFSSTRLLTPAKMKLLPVPADFRNYFLLQSIDNTTNILLGNFVGAEKVFCLIIDKGSDGKVDKIVEYYPDSGKYLYPAKPSSEFYTDLESVKDQIVKGEIFKNNYAYQMRSLNSVTRLIAEGKNIYKTKYGFSIRFFDPDEPTTIMNEFYFNKNVAGGYDLTFKTNYYKSFRTKIVPALRYSIYCRNSKDPIVMKTVGSLFEQVDCN